MSKREHLPRWEIQAAISVPLANLLLEKQWPRRSSVILLPPLPSGGLRLAIPGTTRVADVDEMLLLCGWIFFIGKNGTQAKAIEKGFL